MFSTQHEDIDQQLIEIYEKLKAKLEILAHTEDFSLGDGISTPLHKHGYLGNGNHYISVMSELSNLNDTINSTTTRIIKLEDEKSQNEFINAVKKIFDDCDPVAARSYAGFDRCQPNLFYRKNELPRLLKTRLEPVKTLFHQYMSLLTLSLVPTIACNVAERLVENICEFWQKQEDANGKQQQIEAENKLMHAESKNAEVVVIDRKESILVSLPPLSDLLTEELGKALQEKHASIEEQVKRLQPTSTSSRRLI